MICSFLQVTVIQDVVIKHQTIIDNKHVCISFYSVHSIAVSYRNTKKNNVLAQMRRPVLYGSDYKAHRSMGRTICQIFQTNLTFPGGLG